MARHRSRIKGVRPAVARGENGTIGLSPSAPEGYAVGCGHGAAATAMNPTAPSVMSLESMNLESIMSGTCRYLTAGAVAVVLLAGQPSRADEAPTSATTAPAPKVAVFNLEGEVYERAPEFELTFDFQAPQTLATLIERIEKAAEDPAVPAVVLTFDDAWMGWAQMQELRGALENFRASGKEIYCYLEDASQGLYQLATAATRIVMPPSGELQLTGLYLEATYLKGLLDKIGLEADILHVGAYKSAGEPLTRTGPSEEAREMMNWLADDFFEQMIETIAAGRSMTPEQVRRLIDRGPFYATEALAAGLIDEIVDADDLADALRNRYGRQVELVRDYAVERDEELDMSSPLAFFRILGEAARKKQDTGQANLAVVYVNGMIVPGRTEPGWWDSSDQTGSTDFRRSLARLRTDDAVKGVVLRIDSPGGSAMASDVMWQAVRDLAAAKPVVVSMGNVAASGGYYVAVGAPTIFADPATMTGSIGVVGGKLVTKGLWDWAGVSFHEIQRGANADLMSNNRPFDEAQRARVQSQLEYVYAMFKDRVRLGRSGRLATELEQLAGGRVYTGRQALALGLVDQLGGLADAIAHVADEAGLETYDVRHIPEQRNFLDMMIRQMTGQSDEDKGGGVGIHAGGRLPAGRWPTGGLFERPAVRAALLAIGRADPRGMRAIARVLQRAELLGRERLLAVLEWEFVLR